MSSFLKEALSLAQGRKGFTAPNPAVGAVLVKNGEIVGKGTHWAAGHPHAEVEAIRNAADPKGATLYVTLEPCCHFGKTPPCTDLILQKKIGEVVYGFLDPNPQVSGRGAKILQDCGISVKLVPSKEIAQFYRQYSYWARTHRTWLTGKLALTKNFKTSSKKGTRLKITGELSDRYTHLRRKEADAILTSQKTVRQDDPFLNVRLGGETVSKPVWIVDRTLNLSLQSRINQSSTSLTLIHGKGGNSNREHELLSQGVRLIPIVTSREGLELKTIASEMGKEGLHEAWVECGPTLFRALLRAEQFQEVVLFFSDSIAEDAEGPGEEFLVELLSYEKVSVESLGPDRKEIWIQKEIK